MEERVLGKEEVARLTGTSPSTIHRLEKSGDFPPRRQISRARVGWLESEVTEWLRGRPTAEQYLAETRGER